MKTFVAKPESVQREWFLVDAEDKTLGRIATEIATRLRGKHKAEYTPHVDTGDYIVVINAEKVKVTGNKAKGKIYYSHTEFPGGLKQISFEKLIEKAPERVLQFAVKGIYEHCYARFRPSNAGRLSHGPASGATGKPD